MSWQFDMDNICIAVIGLGYVGFPLAVAFSKKYEDTIGYDLSERRIKELKRGFDITGDFSREELEDLNLHLTNNSGSLRKANFFIIGVPTPIDKNKQPDLSYLKEASKTVGLALHPGSIVVYESTVYPGVTEDVCIPILEEASGLVCGVDFKVGYSPERINPGDKVHTLESVIKVVSGQDEETLDIIAQVYESIVKAGVHRAPSIKVAEAAKVIENSQRDLNIAFVNELSLIFDRLNINTKDVLAAAGTKWNFLKFTPGLVGGHCIGVDPYYLTSKAQTVGYHPQVILAGRRINDDMGRFVAQKSIKLMVRKGISVNNADVAILGITFKENIPDFRNSRVPDIITELNDFGLAPVVFDPYVDSEQVYKQYKIKMTSQTELVEKKYDLVILAVPHSFFIDGGIDVSLLIKDDGVLVDVKGALPNLKNKYQYWSL